MSTTTERPTTFRICQWIRDNVLKRAAEVMVYPWNVQFAADHIRSAGEELTGAEDFRPPNLAELTEVEMDALGFGRWSEDDPMRMIPLWLLPFLPEVIEVKCITGEYVHSKAAMDNDNRGGMLAYGVIPAVGAEATDEGRDHG